MHFVFSHAQRRMKLTEKLRNQISLQICLKYRLLIDNSMLLQFNEFFQFILLIQFERFLIFVLPTEIGINEVNVQETSSEMISIIIRSWITFIIFYTRRLFSIVQTHSDASRTCTKNRRDLFLATPYVKQGTATSERSCPWVWIILGVWKKRSWEMIRNKEPTVSPRAIPRLAASGWFPWERVKAFPDTSRFGPDGDKACTRVDCGTVFKMFTGHVSSGPRATRRTTRETMRRTFRRAVLPVAFILSRARWQLL